MTEAEKTFLVVGLTGSIGSGKSTAGRFFADEGARVVEIDALARELMENSEKIREKIIADFGEDSYLNDGKLNSRKIAGLVFQNPETLERLNRIVHPEVIQAVREAIRNLIKEDYHGIFMIDAPLIFETKLNRLMDVTIVVAASEEACVERVMKRSGLTADEVRARLKNQWPLEKKIELADIVIRNDGTLEQLKEQVQKIYKDLQKQIC